jgi:signal transduction histidine kinase
VQPPKKVNLTDGCDHHGPVQRHGRAALSVERISGRTIWLSIVFVLLIVPAGKLHAQRSGNWRVYRAADGLKESFTTTVTVGPAPRTDMSARHGVSDSVILARHGASGSVSLLDGYSVTTLPSPRGGSFRVYENRTGQLWALHPDGLQEYRDGAWVEHPIREVRNEQSSLARKVRPIPLVPHKRDHVLVLLWDRLLEYNATLGQVRLIRTAADTRLEKFLDMTLARDDGLWITGTKGLAKVSGPLTRIDPQRGWQEFPFDERHGIANLQRPYEDDEGYITGVAEVPASGRKVIACFDGQGWQIHSVGSENIRQAWRGLDQTFWAITINAMWRFDSGGKQPLESEGIPAGQYFDAITEPKGVFWVATSEGLVRYAPLVWRSPAKSEDASGSVYSMIQDAQRRLWFATPNGLRLFDNGRWRTYAFTNEAELFVQPTDKIFALPNSAIALGANDRLLLLEPPTGQYTTVNHPRGHGVKLLGPLKDGRLCLATFPLDGSEKPIALETFDGSSFQAYLPIPPEAIASHDLAFVYETQNGDLWIGGPSTLSVLREKKWQSFGRGEGYLSEGALCILEVEYGKVWVGSKDRIVSFDGKVWSDVGADFYQVNSLIKRRDGTIWCASAGGLYRNVDGAWVINGVEEGLPSAVVYDVQEDGSGRLWACTARGPILLHPDADVEPPKTFIRTSEDSAKVRVDEAVAFSFYGRDKWKYTPADRLLYSYRIDQGQWSVFSPQNFVSFRALRAGAHRFEVRAMDRNCNIDLDPAKLDFVVSVPWHRDPRLTASILAGFVAALSFAALAFNRHRRLVRSYAEVEKIVEQRTRQLETANQQLLHSQKMTALGTLAAGIAHDFNNVLSIIKGSVQIIEGNLENRQKIRTRLERIKTMVEQGSGIVKAMLGYSRAKGEASEPFMAADVVGQTIKLLGDHFLRDTKVVSQTEENLPKAKGSADLLQQMLLNLILNARDAMEGQGKVILRIGGLKRLPEDLVLAPAQADEYVFIAVQDEGCGIAPQILPRIFEPFFTTKAFSTQRGTGLGLSMVYESAKEMGCGLRVETALGKGSTFTIIIPAAPIAVSVQN